MHHTALKKIQVTRDFDANQAFLDMADSNGDGDISDQEMKNYYVKYISSLKDSHWV